MPLRLCLLLTTLSLFAVAQNTSTNYGPTTRSNKPNPHATRNNEEKVLLQEQQNGKQQNGLLGIISDSKCSRVHTVQAGLGATGCTRYCVEHGASYVLVTKNGVVPLSGNKQILENFAGISVVITGGTTVTRAEQIQPSYTPGLVTPVSAHK